MAVWFMIALIPPVLYSIGSFLDKYILNEKVEGGVGSNVLVSATIAVPALILISIVANTLVVDTLTGLITITSGMLTVLSMHAYLMALNRSQVTTVLPQYQLVPVFGFLLAYILLGELLSPLQIIASVIILFGTLFLTSEGDISRLRTKPEPFLLMLVSALALAISSTLFKLFALQDGYWTIQFWEYVGIFLYGVILFAISNASRKDFFVVAQSKRRLLALMYVAELIFFSADLALNYATLLAPVALVHVVKSLEPAIVLLLGACLAAFAPQFTSEKNHEGILKIKVASILIIICGSTLLLW